MFENSRNDNNIGKTTPIGSYNAGKSSLGVYDLSGNVSEWVNDWHGAEYYLFSPEKNPQGPQIGILKVIKGGSWHSFKSDLRSASRGKGGFALKTDGIGFRCAKQLSNN